MSSPEIKLSFSVVEDKAEAIKSELKKFHKKPKYKKGKMNSEKKEELDSNPNKISDFF